MKRRLKTILCLLLVAVLLFACGAPAAEGDGAATSGTGDSASSGSTSQDSGQTAESPSSGASGVVTAMATHGGNAGAFNNAGWWAEIIREKVGIDLEFLNPVDAKEYLLVLRAANDLPDIIATGEFPIAIEMIQAGQLLNLDDHRDSLPNLFGTQHFAGALDFSRDNVSNNTGDLYVIPGFIGEQNFLNFIMCVRWDIYQAIGAPVIETLDDYLPVLKQMMDYYPETEDGQKVWGMSLFSDWDDYTMALTNFMVAYNYGYDVELVSHMMETPVDGSGSPRGLLEDDGMYKKGLKWFFDANQLGIMDPDSPTQNWDTITGKWAEGRILLAPWMWAVGGFNTTDNTDVEDFRGYQAVWPEDFKTMIWPDLPVGRAWAISITQDAKNLEGALAFIDFYYSFEGMDLLYNGPQGVNWDINDAGQRYRTDFGWQIARGDDVEMPGGGKMDAAANAINFQSISSMTMNPASPGQTLSSGHWADVVGANPTRLQLDWREKTGFVDEMEMAIGTGRAIKGHPALQMMPPLPEEYDLTMLQVSNVIKTYSWQIAFATSQAEFDRLWDEMRTNAYELGYQDLIDWNVAAFAEALANAEKYMN